MRKITLHRPEECFNKNCSYEILLGKISLTELKNGEEKKLKSQTNMKTKHLKQKYNGVEAKTWNFRKFQKTKK